MKIPFFGKRFPTREEICLPDEWTVGEGEHDGRPIIVRFLKSAKDLCGHPEYQHQVGIAVPFNQADEKGFPSQEEFKALEDIEDRMTDLLTEGNESLLVGILTCRGMREFVLYTSSPEEVQRKFRQLQASVQSHGLQFMMQPDKDWLTYKQFFCP